MFIAHAPSGYILAISFIEQVRENRASVTAMVLAGILGAVAPDVDMAYFYLVDGGQIHHHRYLSHWPLAWLLLFLSAVIWLMFSRTPKMPLPFVIFSLGGILHLVLDSFVGDIWWFAPFVDQSYALFMVPAIFHPWWLNFILHWSFVIELCICLWAFLIYRRRCKHSLKTDYRFDSNRNQHK